MGKSAIDKKTLRKFGIGLFVILGLIGGLLLWRDRGAWPYFGGASGLALILGLAWPSGLIPVYIFMTWMGRWLGWLNTKIILTLVFFLIFTPMALFFRLIGKDLLDKKIEPDRESYWLSRENPAFTPETYERQF